MNNPAFNFKLWLDDLLIDGIVRHTSHSTKSILYLLFL